MITFIYQNLKNQAAVNFLNILDDFNVRAKVLEVKLSMENERAVVVKTMTALACGILGVSCGSAVMFKSNDPYGTRYTMPLYFGYVLLYLSLLILQFSFATMAIKSRFSVLNDNLRLTFLNISAQHSSLNNAPSIAYTEHLSSVITDLYSNLCDAIDSVNASFTFQLIPFAIYYLTANMFAIYSIVREIFHRSQLMYVVVFTSFCWIVLHTVIISIAVHSGYQATKCALQAPIIVSSIVKNCKWREQKCVVRVLKTFLLEFQHRNVYFENEFFRIDWKLLLSVSWRNTSSWWKTFSLNCSLAVDDFHHHNFPCYHMPVRRSLRRGGSKGGELDVLIN